MSWELLYAVLMIELKFLHVKLYICMGAVTANAF